MTQQFSDIRQVAQNTNPSEKGNKEVSCNFLPGEYIIFSGT